MLLTVSSFRLATVAASAAAAAGFSAPRAVVPLLRGTRSAVAVRSASRSKVTFDLNPRRDGAGSGRSDSWFKRRFNRRMQTSKERSQTTMVYVVSVGILTAGASYAAVPLYRMFCQSSGYGGTTQAGHDPDKVEGMEMKRERVINVKFNADTAATMQWNFRPQQHTIQVHPGETALAFYTAKNPTEKPIDGISTYNVVPFEAGQYFNKIQCFCFEEQRLNPNEEVDMPVFFYIDPEIVEDPFLEEVDTIYLSYTFFEAKPGLQLPTYNSGTGGGGGVRSHPAVQSKVTASS